ncbi:MAG TPA: GAF domain-containing protein [Pyrinomonadaceae bacterium]|nr:GAF domain-containing protein [Pyrinomonadaceae bacterium]
MQSSNKAQNQASNEGTGFVHGMKGIAEHAFAMLVIAAASSLVIAVGGIYFVSKQQIALWLAINFGLAVFGQVLLISLHYAFPKSLNIKRSMPVHLALYLVLALLQLLASTCTLVLASHTKDETLSVTALQTRTLLLSETLASLPNRDGKLYADKIRDVLVHGQSLISLNRPYIKFRLTVVFADGSRTFLNMPQNGYLGEGFDSSLESKFLFDVSPRGSKYPDETEEAYLIRLGRAGWTFVNGTEMLDNDVATQLPTEPWRLKFMPQTQKIVRDFSMFCVPIRDNGDPQGTVIGVLTVSTTEPIEFTEIEKAAVRYVATPLGRYSATPAIDSQVTAKKK